ncbi:GPI ethanolamine phosphate transferase 1 [Nymphaea thermarum]|nr:GPI ethanolamine phosphate transferase 1 [Nymphaea thermarum]
MTKTTCRIGAIPIPGTRSGYLLPTPAETPSVFFLIALLVRVGEGGRAGGMMSGREAAPPLPLSTPSKEEKRKDTERRRRTRSSLRRRERWIVALGIALHAVYMLSIFDIYFKSPIVHGMAPVPQRIRAPAKRLVLLIADGLRADKFFEPDADGLYRAPFLRNIMTTRGRWGVSHARPPTESRPGHVAIIAGFYEDPSAVTKGWKANPVEFDSLFNRSKHTFAFGSPDIIPIFCAALPHSTRKSYPHEFEDFASDASFLDEWSFDQFRALLNKSNDDPKIKQLLHQDNVVIFLHLLGCDTNGHAHKPYSSIYLNNVKVVDDIARRTYDLVENYFKDNATAYIFTADHGMSDKGSHGDGHPSNTETPLVAWGAGVQNPKQSYQKHTEDDGFRFVDEHTHDMPTPAEWGLGNLERVDVNQADIAPLMAEEVEAVLANAKQVLYQFLRKSQLKKLHSLKFKPFEPLENFADVLNQVEDLISLRNYKDALQLAENLRALSLAGLHYFQTYDWLKLMSIITLGYIGWMVYIVLHVLRFYTHLPDMFTKRDKVAFALANNKRVYACGVLLMGIASFLLILEKAPILYHVYLAMTAFLWTQIFADIQFVKDAISFLMLKKSDLIKRLCAYGVVSLFILEFLVASFHERQLYTGFFLVAGVMAAYSNFYSVPGKSMAPVFILIACWFLSSFTMMPAEIPHNTELVVASGGIVILISIWSRWFDMNTQRQQSWQSTICCDSQQIIGSQKLFYLQVFTVALASGMVSLTTSHRTNKQELPTSYQLINWILAGLSLALPLLSPKRMLARLSSVFLGFAPSFLLLSIGYEAVFYSAFALTLMAWVLTECAGQHFAVPKQESLHVERTENTVFHDNDERPLCLADLRVPLSFVRNTGSWMEIGNSISHFGIVSAQVVFVLLLFALTNIYTKDIQVGPSRPSLKAILAFSL